MIKCIYSLNVPKAIDQASPLCLIDNDQQQECSILKFGVPETRDALRVGQMLSHQPPILSLTGRFGKSLVLARLA